VNGGIGTYAKAGSESNSDVGDRSNDAVRIDGSELRCKVIGEGGTWGSPSSAASSTRGTAALNTDFHRQFGRCELLRVEVNLKIC